MRTDILVTVKDSDISFGRPVIVGTRIPTSILAERYQVGELVELWADDYRCDRGHIPIVLEYEGIAA